MKNGKLTALEIKLAKCKEFFFSLNRIWFIDFRYYSFNFFKLIERKTAWNLSHMWASTEQQWFLVLLVKTLIEVGMDQHCFQI